MINLTRLYCDVAQPMDHLRYGRGHGSPTSAAERRPIVVWNITRRCNLKCVHCYQDSDSKFYPGELSWEQCQAVVDDLADYKVPALLLSGGEPTIHPKFFELAEYATGKGLRLTLSTNGTLINPEWAQRIKDIGFSYVGISLDGMGATHDHFRGKVGAFDKAVAAFRNCKAVGQKVGLRLTLSRHNIADIEGILDFIEREDIERVCFYHLVYSGRGSELMEVPHEETRGAIDKILDRTAKWAATVLGELHHATQAPRSFWNLNFPHFPPGQDAIPPRVRCDPAKSPLNVAYTRREDGNSLQFDYCASYAQRPRDPGSDVEACFGGKVAISLLSV